jgi:UDP-2,4-diacetamido-2,4,6-trideoxy-beta-L-altropyranose hydrolase
VSLRIAFRVDASRQIGTGHVMRCLALASALSAEGVRCFFICREHTGHLIDLICREGYEVLRLPQSSLPLPTAEEQWLGTDWQSDAEQTLEALKGAPPDWLVVDHYSLEARWESILRENCGRLMVIDDLADRSHDCDLLLDQNLVANMFNRYESLLPEQGASLLGPRYALLQPAYAALHEEARPRSGQPQRLFVFFGGVDKDNLTQTALSALLKLDLSNLQVDVVVADSNPHREALEKLVSEAPNIHLHGSQPTLAPMLLAADLAIGAGGSTNWERLCLGLPTLVITLANNQHLIVDELDKRGLVRWIGDKDSIQVDALVAQISIFLQQSLDTWSASCLKVVDGLGVGRVCAALLANKNTVLIARSACQDDEAQLLEWANDPLTRRNSFSGGQILPESHHLWFSQCLAKADCQLYLIETAGGLAAGQVRFERAHSAWEVHFTLSPVLRGRDLGSSLLKTALDAFVKAKPGVVVFGEVKAENRASCRIFEALNFSLVSAVDADVAIYQSNQF